MLQWMGGARRKVTSTRKSTQKRQKQYFEQRRRQQQAAEGGNYFEGKTTYCQHTENNKSLDILNFRNLSTVAQESKSSCPLARNESQCDALNCESVQHPPAIQSFQINEVTPPGPSEIEEARFLSSYQTGNAYPKTLLKLFGKILNEINICSAPRTSANGHGNHARALNSDCDKMNQLKMAPEYKELCMIDILGDDDMNVFSDKGSVREAHAAFSIEGLGKVGMETPVHTPVHSPEAHGRTLLNVCSSPSEAMKPLYSFNLNKELVNLEFELDAMMQEVDVPFSKSSVENSFCSKDRLDFFNRPKQKLLDTKEFSLFSDNDNDYTNILGDDELYYYNRERNKHIWDATSRPGNILEENDFGLSYNNWMDQTYASDDYFYSMDSRKKEFNYQGAYQQKSRTTMGKSGKFEPIESPAPYLNGRDLENFRGFTVPDMTWHSPAQRDHHDRDVLDQRTRSCFITEDTRDNLSLLSEESCSSSAVWGVSKKDTLNSKDKQSLKRVDFGCSENICYEHNTFSREENCCKWNIPQQGENINGPGKFTRISNPSRSKQADISNVTSKKRLKPEEIGRVFEAENDPGNNCRKSETRKHSSSSFEHRVEDLFGTLGDPTSCNSRPFYEGFGKLSAGYSPCHNLTSPKDDLYQPKLENVKLGSNMPNFSVDCNVGYRPQKSLHADSCLVSEKQSITREADENSDFPATSHENFEARRDISPDRKSLSSENGKSTDAADFEDKHGCKVPSYETSKVGESIKENNCLEHGEETSPSVEDSSMLDQCHVNTKCQLDAQSSLQCQTGFGVNVKVEGFGVEERRLGSGGQSNIDSTCQVMMLDSCVLQLLCIQVLKEASAKVTDKKA